MEEARVGVSMQEGCSLWFPDLGGSLLTQDLARLPTAPLTQYLVSHSVITIFTYGEGGSGFLLWCLEYFPLQEIENPDQTGFSSKENLLA